jgi:hypothetical protein
MSSAIIAYQLLGHATISTPYKFYSTAISSLIAINYNLCQPAASGAWIQIWYPPVIRRIIFSKKPTISSNICPDSRKAQNSSAVASGCTVPINFDGQSKRAAEIRSSSSEYCVLGVTRTTTQNTLITPLKLRFMLIGMYLPHSIY